MIVYLITNKINGKRYVGQTVQTLSARFSKHCYLRTANEGMPIVHAIQKYGKGNFEIKVLATCDSIEQMNHRESCYIGILKTRTPHGYNVLSGGSNSRHTEETERKIGQSNIGKHTGRKCTEETKKRMSESRMGIKRSPEFKKGCSERVKGEKHPMFGKHHSEDSKQKISIALIGVNTWSKGKKATQETKQKISIASTGRSPTLEVKQKLSLINSHPDMEVFCHQTNMTYSSTSQAARVLGLNRGKVKNVLKGRSEHTKGYTFIYTRKENKKKVNPKKKKPIFCIETRETFVSTLDAIKKLKLSPPGVYNSLRTGKSVKGYTFKYVDEDTK
jgi:group I intron endonuclease